MTPELVRVAQTESFFRDVNEQIAEAAERFDAREAEFHCECDDAGCAQRVEAPLDEYDAVRADATHFLLAPGHHEPAFERVVTRRGGYAIVEKVEPVLRGLVRRLDPRGPAAQPDSP